MNSNYQQPNSPETRLEDARFVVVQQARRSLQNGLRFAFPQITQHLAGRQVLHEQQLRQDVAEDLGHMLDNQIPAQIETISIAPTVDIYDNQRLIQEAQIAVDKANRGDYGLSA